MGRTIPGALAQALYYCASSARCLRRPDTGAVTFIPKTATIHTIDSAYIPNIRAIARNGKTGL